MLIKAQVDELALWMLTVQTPGATAAAGIPAMRGADGKGQGCWHEKLAWTQGARISIFSVSFPHTRACACSLSLTHTESWELGMKETGSCFLPAPN